MISTTEKAKELVDNFRLNVLDYEGCGINEHKAKQCALIAVDEIIKSIVITDLTTAEYQFNYWEEVKQEIEKL
jgi:hypothetical protein